MFRFGTTYSKLTAECPFADIAKYDGLRAKVNRKSVNVQGLSPKLASTVPAKSLPVGAFKF
jgi:hypothetical protein